MRQSSDSGWQNSLGVRIVAAWPLLSNSFNVNNELPVNNLPVTLNEGFIQAL